VTARRTKLIAWSLGGLTATMTIVALTLDVMGVSRHGTLDNLVVGVALAGVLIPWSLIGLLVATRRPGNAIGWLFLVAALGMAIDIAAVAYAGLAETFAPALPEALWIAWLDIWMWPVFGLILPIAVFMIFPSGRFLSVRWRYATIVLLALGAATTASDALAPGTAGENFENFENPIGVESQVRDAVSWFGVHLLGPFVMAFVIIALVCRFRRSDGEGRAQIKWVLLTAALACAGFLGAFLSGLTAAFVFGLVALAATPVAAGLAILKYRLYEIDRIVNRTVVYGVATALLAGLYFAIVIGLQQIFSGLTRGNDLAIAGSTLAVAALFRPARRRIQALVDRRFYRGRYDAELILAAFSARLRDEVDLDELGADLGQAVRDTMQPGHVSLWLRAPTAETER